MVVVVLWELWVVWFGFSGLGVLLTVVGVHGCLWTI